MARARFRVLALGVAATALLAGCVEGEGPFAAGPSTGEEASSSPSFAASGKPQDIEAPEVFQVTETALWDGRPSLGGVWVASPDTTDPERVIMRNPSNGKSVVGALFRRERDNPGPKLQISSDAAEALGLLAGQPAQINVTALRRAEVAAPKPAAAPAAEAIGDAATEAAQTEAAQTETSKTETSKTGDAAAKSAAGGAAEATAVAAAALAAVDAVDANADSAPASDGTAGAAPADADAATVDQPVKKKTWRERRAEAKAKREAERAAKAAAAAGAAAGAEGEAAATAAIVSDIETAPLDGGSPAATPEPETKKSDAPARATIGSAVGASAQPKSTAEAQPGSEPSPATAAGAGRPIQIGFFSEEANADRAVAALAKAGVPATARKEESNGKVYWTVTARGDAATLGKAKAAGFADAYFLK
ncbi:SPOR domain-containing protein [Tabrizicola sp. BL-A-41-H6]|uniref:SPOR domain-containing protein n=1 Tax=Tabrizicola sp. BL-A-41-H6 TaxID=3421107 RepID=UPI003D66DC84